MEILNALARSCLRVELVWIKAHHNYVGNERADELARNAIFNNIVLFGTYPPHSYLSANYGQVYTISGLKYGSHKTHVE